MSVVDWEQLSVVLSGISQVKFVEINRESKSVLVNAEGKQRLEPVNNSV